MNDISETRAHFECATCGHEWPKAVAEAEGAREVRDANGNLLSDVWSSFDGVTWSLRTPAALPHPRAKIALAEKDNLLYLFGGESIETEDSGRGINEMWMSANGERWFKLYKNEIEVP